jgi:hypothetical protein
MDQAAAGVAGARPRMSRARAGAGQHRLRHHREAPPAGADDGEPRVRGQQVAGVEHGLGRGLEAVLHAEHEGAEDRAGERAVAQQVAQEGDVAGVEQLDLGHRAGGADGDGHAADVERRVDDHLGPRVHGVEVEGGDVGPQCGDVGGAPLRRGERGAGAGELRVGLTGDEAAARAGGEVDDDLRVPLADALHDLPVEAEVHGGSAGFGVAHMEVDLGGAGLGRLQRAFGDLPRRDRQVRRRLRRGQVAGDGAGDDHLVAHRAHRSGLRQRARPPSTRTVEPVE